ncbi:MAG: hypothetical protein ABEI80_03010 [Haloplanus sp.]
MRSVPALTDARVRAGLTVVGGVLWALVPVLFRAAPRFVDVAVVVPPCLALGLLEIHRRYGTALDRSGTVGERFVAIGLAGGFVALLANAVYPNALFKLLVVGLPAFVGGVCLAIGTPLLAYALWRIRRVSTSLAVVWGLAVPASVALNAVVTPRLNAGLGLYGIAWTLVGVRLWRETDAEAAVADRRPPLATVAPVDPSVAAATLGGGTLSVVGLAGFVPLGPVTAIAFVGLTPAFDGLHLALGLAGLCSVALPRPRYAALYDRIVGTATLLLAFVLLGQVVDLYHLVTAHWTLPFLHLTVGIVLAVVGVESPRTR